MALLEDVKTEVTSTLSVDTFTGDGTTTAFTLSQAPSSEDNLIVFIEGVYQNPGDFTLSGTTLTLDVAPANTRKIVAYHVSGAVSGNNLNHDQFTADGSTAAFTLSIAPIHENNTQVFIDGVYQQKDSYAVSGTTLTLDSNPANGAKVEVMTFTQTDVNTIPASFVAGLTEVSAVGSDHLLVYDATDGALKKALASDLIETVGATPTFSTANITNTTTGDSLLFTTTEDSSTAAPVITLKRNSSSPADADYLGQLKFKGENDADQEVVYAKITSKIQDASDGSEDGLLEFANIKAGSQTITARLKSDKLQLLNSTGLEVAGLTYPTSDGTNGQALVTDGSGNLSFSTVSGGVDGISSSADATAITIDSSERVGIGTTSPEEALHVSGNMVLDDADPRIFLQTGSSHYNWKISAQDSVNKGFEISSGEVDADANSDTFTSRFVIEADTGDVGIGTSSPAHKLHVNGTSKMDANDSIRIASMNALGQTSSGAMFILGHNAHVDGTTANVVKAINSSWYPSFIKMYYNDGITFHTQTSSQATAGDTLLSGTGANSLERLRIDDVALHSGGMFRAGGWYGTYNGYSTGHSMEIGRTGSYAYSLSYDRSLGQYKGNIVSGYDIRFQCQGNQRIVISDSGHLYPYLDDTYDLGLSNKRFDDIYATSGTVNTSDRNEKNTITDTDLGLDFINRLSPKSYKFNGKTRIHYGLIAQDIEDVLEDINKPTSDFAGFIKSQKYRQVGEEITNDDGTIIEEPINEIVEGEYTYGLRYTEFISPMIKAIQELKADNDALRARIETLENA